MIDVVAVPNPDIVLGSEPVENLLVRCIEPGGGGRAAVVMAWVVRMLLCLLKSVKTGVIRWRFDSSGVMVEGLRRGYPTTVGPLYEAGIVHQVLQQ